MPIVEAIRRLEGALEKGRPEIFNTDQGSQFTSREFTSKLSEASIEISMDGRGRVTDNVFIERLWKIVKYEEIYYDYDRPHQGLDDQTPWEVYRPKRQKRLADAI